MSMHVYVLWVLSYTSGCPSHLVTGLCPFFQRHTYTLIALKPDVSSLGEKCNAVIRWVILSLKGWYESLLCRIVVCLEAIVLPYLICLPKTIFDLKPSWAFCLEASACMYLIMSLLEMTIILHLPHSCKGTCHEHCYCRMIKKMSGIKPFLTVPPASPMCVWTHLQKLWRLSDN